MRTILEKEKQTTYMFMKAIPPGYALGLLPFYDVEFFPKHRYIMDSSLLKHAVGLTGEALHETIVSPSNHEDSHEVLKCKLAVQNARQPKALTMLLAFYQMHVGSSDK